MQNVYLHRVFRKCSYISYSPIVYIIYLGLKQKANALYILAWYGLVTNCITAPLSQEHPTDRFGKLSVRKALNPLQFSQNNFRLELS